MRYEGIPLPFNMEQTDSVFVLLLFCFMFFAHIYSGGFSFLKENLMLVYSSERSIRLGKENTIKEAWYNYFLVFQAIVLASVSLFDIFMEYIPSNRQHITPLITIASFILLISVCFVLKILFYKLLGYIFNMQSLASGWNSTYIIVFEILGILYFIPTLLLIYSDFWHKFIIGFMLILFLISQIILLGRIVFFFFKEKFNFLFLIAYLCSVEIMPLLFLYAGLVYIYRIDII